MRGRDQAPNAYWGLPIFHPRLHLAAEGPILAIAAEQEFHRYDSSGERLWTHTLPSLQRLDRRIEITDLPPARTGFPGLVWLRPQMWTEFGPVTYAWLSIGC